MDATPSVTFGDLLRRFRRAAGITQEELAERAHVSPRAISDLERGVRTRPWHETVTFLADALQLEAAERAQLETVARRHVISNATEPPGGNVRPTVGALRTNLPSSATRLIGRERELADLREILLRPDVRLVTLTGAGGIGKTRLGLQLGREALDEFADGVWLVELAALTDPVLVPGLVARALGLRDEAGQPILDRLLQHLRSRRLLLLLDNCEHLIDACASLTRSVLAACPEVAILATSREPLRLRGENVFRVPSLPVPVSEQMVSAADLSQYESSRLFADRAREGSGFELTDGNAAVVARICRSLDGIPLALELAAATLSALSVEQVASRLDRQFRLLALGDRSALPRQQTMRATIDWSYDLLPDAEQRLWRRLAVFAGGFTLEAVEAQNSLPGDVSDAEILALVRNLVDKSLVVREEREGTARYRLLEPLRQYAWEKLIEVGDSDVTRERHVDWCLALTAGFEADYHGPNPVAAAERIALDHDNLRAALGWCLDRDPTRGLRLTRNLDQFWMAWGLDPEGQRWRDALLARATEDTPERAWALVISGMVTRDFGDYPTAISRLREGHETATKVGDRSALNWTLCLFGYIAAERGNYVEAKAWYEDSLRLAREIGNDSAAADTLSGLVQLARYQGEYAHAQAVLDEYLADKWVQNQPVFFALGLAQSGFLAQATGDLPRAKALLEESVALMRGVVDRPSLGIALAHLGYLLGSTGDFKQAAALLRESVELFQKLGHRPRAARTLFFWGLVAIREGFHAHGVTLLAAAEATPGYFLAGLDPVQRADRDARLADARQALGDAAADEAWARGREMSFDEAVAFALRAT